jgi:tetratricopeptide (TPR) repeat protein/tRNA A-37 threonylcarbamoyl transferase component Bud32
VADPEHFTGLSEGPASEEPSPAQTTNANATVDDGPAGTQGPAAPRTDVPRYTLRDEIARGGMGAIYRATDSVLGREVAVKVLQDRYTDQSTVARRFIDEALITGQLQHPGIPPVHDLGTSPEGRPFLVMKLIKGQTLAEQLQHRTAGAADAGRLVAVFEQVCQAVAYAHAHQVVHRDLKPSNVMVGAFGEVQVMDWGLAKVMVSRERERPEEMADAAAAGTEVRSLRESDGVNTQAGSVLGTPAYMPPEQAIGAVDQVDARSDVFGLGGILCAILTGRAPFVAATAEATRQLAALGKLADAFARLDASGADPDLVALCKRCLSREKEERPTDAGEVARAVADLRAAADERARRAELDRVKAEGEKATAEARAAERRKRRRLWTGAAAALTAAVVLGLLAVLIVQRRANDELEAKNRELDDEQAKVQARFELAQEAIETFHTGVSEELLLKQKHFKELRTRLLKKAAAFYAQLEKLLEGQTDFRSRRAVAASYFQLGEVTGKIGSQTEALALHRKALALRRELAAAPEADVETRLDVARSLGAVGSLLEDTGNRPGALAMYQEQRTLAEQLAAQAPTASVLAVQASGYHRVAHVLEGTGKPAQALEAYQQAQAIRQQLVDANPAVSGFQKDLATTHNNIGVVYHKTGRLEQAMASYKDALAIREKLVAANPGVSDLQSVLAMSLSNIGVVYKHTGKPKEALQSFHQAVGIFRKLVEANPAVQLLPGGAGPGDRPHRRRAYGCEAVGGSAGAVPGGAGRLSETGRRQPERDQLPHRRGRDQQQHGPGLRSPKALPRGPGQSEHRSCPVPKNGPGAAQPYRQHQRAGLQLYCSHSSFSGSLLVRLLFLCCW